jgi:hypothetical protein
VQEKCNISLTNSYPQTLLVQRDAFSGITLSTGVFPGSKNMNLWVISCSATNHSLPWDSSDGAWYNQLSNSPINPRDISILDRPLDSNGNAYVMLPDNTNLIVTPVVVANFAYYTYNIAATNIAPQIFFFGTNVTGSNVTVIVGQQINLTASFGSGGPVCSNFTWSVPGYAISNYDIVNGILYSNFPVTNSSVTFYWVDQGPKQLSCSFVCSGVSNTAALHFSVLSPTFTIVDLPPAWATNFVEDGATTLGLGDKNSFGAMKYNVYISTPYPFATKYAGRADILQLINRTAANGVSFYTTSNQFYLDTEPFYTTHARGQNRVKPILPGSHLQFSDGPSYEEDYSSSQEAFLTSIVDQHYVQDR